MRWAGHVARTEETSGKVHAGLWRKKIQERSQLVRTSHRWKGNITMYLEQIGRWWIGFMWYRIGKIGGLCEHGNEPSGSTKYEEFE
jgi:hypothetical protein